MGCVLGRPDADADADAVNVGSKPLTAAQLVQLIEKEMLGDCGPAELYTTAFCAAWNARRHRSQPRADSSTMGHVFFRRGRPGAIDKQHRIKVCMRDDGALLVVQGTQPGQEQLCMMTYIVPLTRDQVLRVMACTVPPV